MSAIEVKIDELHPNCGVEMQAIPGDGHGSDLYYGVRPPLIRFRAFSTEEHSAGPKKSKWSGWFHSTDTIYLTWGAFDWAQTDVSMKVGTWAV